MISDASYKLFTRRFRQLRGNKPTIGEMEITVRCPLRCEHCYNDYPQTEQKELTTTQIKEIIDKNARDGVIWFGFTGGDPLVREDFPEIYIYAKKKGFLLSFGSSLVTLNKKLLNMFLQYPPSQIETTLNAVTSSTYIKVTKRDLLDKHLDAIKTLLKKKFTVNVKTQVTTQNIHEVKKIKHTIEGLGVKFIPAFILHARLDGDTYPTGLRISAEEMMTVGKALGSLNYGARKTFINNLINRPKRNKLFNCSACGEGFRFWISLRGDMLLCPFLEKAGPTFKYSLLVKDHSVKDGFDILSNKMRGIYFRSKSKCRTCLYRSVCLWCPARSLQEKGLLDEPIGYYCSLTKAFIADSTSVLPQIKL